MRSTQGVVVPVGQTRGTARGEPEKVYAVLPVEQFAIQYADAHGAMIKAFVYKVGDDIYMPKDSEAFANSIGTLKPTYAAQIKKMLAATAAKKGAAELTPDAAVALKTAAEVDV